jgi:Na+/alanine symporter
VRPKRQGTDVDTLRIIGYGLAISLSGAGVVLWICAGALVSDALREARAAKRRRP